MKLFIGTYTKSCESKGIYVYDFNPQTGEAKQIAASEQLLNPSYLTLSNDHRFVYCVNENATSSTLSALKFNEETSGLKLLNQQDSKGAAPCYVTNDAHHVIAANYEGGSIAVFAKNPDGSLGKASQVIVHQGKSINKDRQEGPHVHMVGFTPDHKFVVATDLGTDEIYIYSYNPHSRTAILEFKNIIKVKAGSGPRHLVFSADKRFAYLLHELDGTLTGFSYRAGNFSMVFETTIAAKDFKGEVSAAALRITPDSKFLYATNRGDANEISCFLIGENGHLELVQKTPSLGNGPRDLAIDPTGQYALVAHEKSNEVVVFRIDKTSGILTDSGGRIGLCAPVCVVFS